MLSTIIDTLLYASWMKIYFQYQSCSSWISFTIMAFYMVLEKKLNRQCILYLATKRATTWLLMSYSKATVQQFPGLEILSSTCQTLPVLRNSKKAMSCARAATTQTERKVSDPFLRKKRLVVCNSFTALLNPMSCFQLHLEREDGRCTIVHWGSLYYICTKTNMAFVAIACITPYVFTML